MTSQQLNDIVCEFRQTNDQNLFNKIFLEITPFIERALDELSSKVDDTSYFQKRIDERLTRAIHSFDTALGSFYSYVKSIIEREKAFIIKRYAKIDSVSLEHLDEISTDRGGFQLRSESPSVESQVIVMNDVTLLAQGDNRKSVILTEWTNGLNDSEISRVLVHHFGGQADSHYKYIMRFRKKLRASTEMFA